MELQSFDPLAALRILCGVWFIPHCIGKLRNIGPASVTFEKAGLRPPHAFLFVTILLEIAAGVGLVFDIFPRLAAACAVIILAGAAYAVVKINGFNWRWQRQGPEYAIFWALACVLSVWRA